MKTKTFIKATIYTLAMHYRSWPRRAAETVGDALFHSAKALVTVTGIVTAPLISPFVVLFEGVDATKTDEAWRKLWHGCRSCGRSGRVCEGFYTCPRCGGKGWL